MPRLSPYGYRFIVAVLVLLVDAASRICLADPTADRASDSVRGRHLPLVSSGVVRLPDSRIGSSRAFLARDPDGHVLAFSTHD